VPGDRRQGQFGEGVGNAGSRRYVCSKIVEAAAEVLDECIAGADHLALRVSLQSSHRSKPGLQASVVGFERVVRVDLSVIEGPRQHLTDDTGIDPVSVGDDLDRCDPGAADRSIEEAASCLGVPAR
jgi:hypothetical protein